MPKVQIVHKPGCSTSRGALQILEENGIDHEVVLYLTKKLSFKKIEILVRKLGVRPLDMIRKKELLFQEQFADKNLNDNEWIQAMVDNPVLIERPIVIKGNKAVIARPPELIFRFLKIKNSQPR